MIPEIYSIQYAAMVTQQQQGQPLVNMLSKVIEVDPTREEDTQWPCTVATGPHLLRAASPLSTRSANDDCKA